jgi:hypothetical protein
MTGTIQCTLDLDAKPNEDARGDGDARDEPDPETDLGRELAAAARA